MLQGNTAFQPQYGTPAWIKFPAPYHRIPGLFSWPVLVERPREIGTTRPRGWAQANVSTASTAATTVSPRLDPQSVATSKLLDWRLSRTETSQRPAVALPAPCT